MVAIIPVCHGGLRDRSTSLIHNYQINSKVFELGKTSGTASCSKNAFRLGAEVFSAQLCHCE